MTARTASVLNLLALAKIIKVMPKRIEATLCSHAPIRRYL